MKKLFSVVLCVLLMCTCCLFAGGCGDTAPESENALGDYEVEIKEYRLAQDANGTDVIVIKFGFKNNWEESTSFYASLLTEVYQGDIGLTECFEPEGIEGYSENDMMKNIKTGATIDVEVAYELNDTTTDVTVEVSELFTFSDKTLTKTFSLQ